MAKFLHFFSGNFFLGFFAAFLTDLKICVFIQILTFRGHFFIYSYYHFLHIFKPDTHETSQKTRKLFFKLIKNYKIFLFLSQDYQVVKIIAD
jgi:hypothetical protein